MADDWVDPSDDAEGVDGEQPVGTDEDLDESGYDSGDDPGTRAPEFPAEPPRSPDRGPLPISPAAIPAWVKPLGNGKVPMDRMIKVAPLGVGYLIPEAAAAWRNLQNAAQQAGFALTMTGAYRSYDQQVSLFQQRYSTSNTGGSSKVWNGTRYWLKPKMAMAAVPGDQQPRMGLRGGRRARRVRQQRPGGRPGVRPVGPAGGTRQRLVVGGAVRTVALPARPVQRRAHRPRRAARRRRCSPRRPRPSS